MKAVTPMLEYGEYGRPKVWKVQGPVEAEGGLSLTMPGQAIIPLLRGSIGLRGATRWPAEHCCSKAMFNWSCTTDPQAKKSGRLMDDSNPGRSNVR